MECDICKKDTRDRQCMWRMNADATLTTQEKLQIECNQFELDKEIKIQRDIKNKEW